MAQVAYGSHHDKLYLAYLRGYVLAHDAVEASLLPSSTEDLAAWALGREHGAARTPVRSVASVVESLSVMLRDPTTSDQPSVESAVAEMLEKAAKSAALS